jgi:hypothetical protein
MEMDAIKITTNQSGKRKGKLVSSEFENSTDRTEFDILLYKIKSKEVDIWDVDSLTDGEYPLGLFKFVGVAAPVVAQDQKTPVYNHPDTYRYIRDEEPI